MSPAGDWTCLRAALQNGADAVYFGLRGLNMRSSSRNFAAADMKRIARECHNAGARAYLALNTMIYENEIARVDRVLKAAALDFAENLDGLSDAFPSFDFANEIFQTVAQKTGEVIRAGV